jgi:hypothetical protein
VTRPRRLSAYLDALVAGRRPGRLRADPEDVELVRTAIALRAARPGDAAPDQQFVSALYHELADEAVSPVVPIDRPSAASRRRRAAVTIAAGVALVGGTAAVTGAIDQGTLVPAAVHAPQGSDLRTGTFETTNSQVMGQVVAYNGKPSWVFMSVDVPNYEGKITCTIQGKNGSTVATGAFALHAGAGQWSKTVHADIGQLRGAQLITSTGETLASATFA